MDENAEFDPIAALAEATAAANRMIVEIKALTAEIRAANRANQTGHRAAINAHRRA